MLEAENPILNEVALRLFKYPLPDDQGNMLMVLTPIFKKTIPMKIKGIQTALKQKDYVHLKLHAHALRSSALNLGACRLAFISQSIEEAAAAHKELEKIRELTAQLPALFKQAVEEIEQLIGCSDN